MFSFFTEFQNAQQLARQRFHVIFYAENQYYFQYFRHLYESLLHIPEIEIAYISSDKKDPRLHDSRVQCFYLKSTLAGIFPRLQADVMIMTMPDLQNFIFKKSSAVGRYIYVFHALVSTHQQYRPHAFDHYEVMFCTGPQQEEEIRESEQLYSLKPKECIAYGYPLLEELREKCRTTLRNKQKILIAPSWYNEGILNTCIVPLLAELTKKEPEIWIRPHPEFIKRNKAMYGQLAKKILENKNIFFDTSPSVYTHLADAGQLITDRSGIALEYALASYRPVLFIDTPLKIQNPEVDRFSIKPLENAVRSKLGISLLPKELHLVNKTIDQLKNASDDYSDFIQSIEKEIVFPPVPMEKWP